MPMREIIKSINGRNLEICIQKCDVELPINCTEKLKKNIETTVTELVPYVKLTAEALG